MVIWYASLAQGYRCSKDKHQSFIGILQFLLIRRMPHPENHTNQRQSSNFPSQQTNLAKHGFAMVSPNYGGYWRIIGGYLKLPKWSKILMVPHLFPNKMTRKIPQLSTPVSQHRATRPGNSFHGGNNDRPALRAQQATVVSRWASFSVSESQIDPRG